MSKRYRRRRRYYVSPMMILAAVLLAAAVIAILVLRRPGKEPEPQEPKDTQQQQQQTGDGQQQEDEPKKPLTAETSDGVLCTLTDMGQDALYTGQLILVNNWTEYHFPEEQDLVCILEQSNGAYIVRDYSVYLSPVAMDALNDMMADFREQGGSKTVNVVAGYRTAEDQQGLYDRSAERNGKDHADKYVAKPGGSEHHTGFVVDFSIRNADGTSSDYDGSGEYAWINENCHNYGWVVRYDQDKAELTGIYDEPWHFRYVGIPHATKMAELDLCLEEYIDYLKDYTFEGEHLMIECVDGTYEVWYAQGTKTYLPVSGSYQVSGNNVDGVIVTYKVKQ